MARIRSIKPEFWTSEQIAECSPNARLLFIGLWSFSDDAGIHPASVGRLKMEVFPADDIPKAEVADLVCELLDAGLIVEYEVDGQPYWKVTGWEKHQRIEKPTFKYPSPDGEVQPAPKRPKPKSGLRDHSRARNAAKARILDRDGWGCAYCADTGPHLVLDHVVPIARGGVDDDSNLVLACERCNSTKGTGTVEDLSKRIRRPIADMSSTIRRLVDYSSPPDWSGVERSGEDPVAPEGATSVSSSPGLDLGKAVGVGGDLLPEDPSLVALRPLPRANTVAPDRVYPVVCRVFETWRDVMGHPHAKLDRKRESCIRAALKLGYTEDQLIQAVMGYTQSPHHMGQNDRNTRYDDLTLLLRDAAHIDAGIRFLNAPPAGNDLESRNRAAVAAWLASEAEQETLL